MGVLNLLKVKTNKTSQRAVTYVIEVNDFKYEVVSGLRGHLEATTDLEATKMAVRSNMHN